MNQRERLDAIKEKHLKEQEKRKIFIHRLIAAGAVIIVIVIAVFLIKGCVSLISRHAEEKRNAEAMQQTQSPDTAQAVVLDANGINQTFFSSSAFVGNSFIEGMSLYNLIDGADYFSKVGLNVNDAMTQGREQGGVPVIEELKSDRQYNNIFMMFGENELGWVSSDSFAQQYGALIDKAREYQPQSKIYLLAITPVTKKVSEENKDNTNNDSIMQYNSIIQELAKSKNAVYADLYSAVAGEDGNLPEEAASDGIHFGEEYYKKCLIYMQNNL